MHLGDFLPKTIAQPLRHRDRAVEPVRDTGVISRMWFEMLEPRLLLAGDVIADPSLLEVIREEIGKPVGPVTAMDLQSLSTLDASGRHIRGIDGLEYATGLRWLNLAGNGIADIRPLAGLTGLTTLNLGFNPLVDPSVLANLPGLQELSLAGTGIDDIGFLTGMIDLAHLDLADNYIEDITPLAGLGNLAHLELGGNFISDVSPLVDLGGLDHLDLACNGIGNPSLLGELSSLVYLDLSGCDVRDIGFVSRLANLEELGLYSNSVADLRPLGWLSNLRRLHLGENRISDLRPLANLTGLEDLDVFANQITDLTPLVGMSGLRSLYIESNAIEDISPLAGMHRLQTLSIPHNLISDIGSLVWLTELSTLDISHNCLDLGEESAAATIIDALLARNVNVTWEPQTAPLIVTGQAGNDVIRVTRNGTDVDIYFGEDGSVDPMATADISVLSSVRIDAGEGDDILILDFSNHSPIPPGGLSIDGGGHSSDAGNVLILLGLPDDAELTVGDSRITVGTGTISYSNIQGIRIPTGRLESLRLTGSSSAAVVAGNGPALRLGSLALSDEATLDLGDSGLIVSGGKDVESVAECVITRVRSAMGKGDWTGRGLTSSVARLAPFATLACLVNDSTDGSGPLFERFPHSEGVPVSATDILVRVTWLGDANLDGLMNADDYFLIDRGYFMNARGYINGDFNYDDVVNADDYFLVDQAFIGTIRGQVPSVGDAPLLSILGTGRVEGRPPREGINAEIFATESLF